MDGRKETWDDDEEGENKQKLHSFNGNKKVANLINISLWSRNT